jgi:hypothetical protein
MKTGRSSGLELDRPEREVGWKARFNSLGLGRLELDYAVLDQAKIGIACVGTVLHIDQDRIGISIIGGIGVHLVVRRYAELHGACALVARICSDVVDNQGRTNSKTIRRLKLAYVEAHPGSVVGELKLSRHIGGITIFIRVGGI